ncbi:Acyl-CoA dehydrogenase [Mameliella alba]|uniref:Acyl-CoA dehydrogenase n=1 Tax=Mameliella alba TaxID=561184 RepID=A0A0B3S516_9RHOB|nr:Acyl-CoA dehydrogenase [Mameliella alba]
MSYPACLAVCREVPKACTSTGIVWETNVHAISPLVDFASHDQKNRWLPVIANGGLAALALTEPSAGSDATGMKTTFREDEILVNGSKIFITNGDVADIIVLFGKWAELGDGRDAISVAVIEKGAPGFEVIGTDKKMGSRASSTAALSFNTCRIPRANLLGKPGEGLKMLYDFLRKSRPSVAAQALGIARAAFEDAIAYVNDCPAPLKRLRFEVSLFSKRGDRRCGKAVSAKSRSSAS